MSELRLVHTADVHLGIGQLGLGESYAYATTRLEHRQRIQDAFGRCVDLCLERDAHLFIVAGDLFDSPQPPETTADFVITQLLRLNTAHPAIHSMILPGNHDPIERGSIYSRWLAAGLPERVHLLTAEQSQVHLADCQATVFGLLPEHGQRPLQGLEPDPQARFNIAVVHAGVQIPGMPMDDWLHITQQDIAASGMDYIALGHGHRFRDYSGGGVTALIPGEPEIAELHRENRGQALVVELHADGTAHWDLVRTGTLRYEQSRIDLADFAGEVAIRQALVAQAGPDKIIDIHLTGLAPAGMVIDAERLAEELAGSFFRVRVVDESHVGVEALDETRYPPQLVTGRFIRLMKEHIATATQQEDVEARAVAESALQIGLALLEGREVLG